MARAAHLSLRPPRPNEDRPPAQRKGRGAGSNQTGRYETEQREAVDDGWGSAGGQSEDDGLPALRTDVTIETPRKIITSNTSPFVDFDRSINPYRGCEHGCIYCFARPTHAYMGLSPGLDFESKLFAKPSAQRLLEKEFSNKNYKPRLIAMGTNTDPYQPVERKFQIMRGILSIFSRFNHPLSIVTKAHLVTRDIDILAPMAEKDLATVTLSITTQDKTLARSMEPRASSPQKRFDALKQLSDAGIPVGVMTGPMIPGLNDDEMEAILEKAAEAGATFANYTMLRLPLEVSPLFQEWLETFAPNRAARIMRHIREMNGGKDYDPHWSRGREIKSHYAKLVGQRFKAARHRFGLTGGKPALDLSRFSVPSEISGQMSLFQEAGL